jgi:hypothetical protein
MPQPIRRAWCVIGDPHEREQACGTSVIYRVSAPELRISCGGTTAEPSWPLRSSRFTLRDVGGTLPDTDSTHGSKLALLGNYMATSFVTAGVGHGGTLITEAAQTGNLLVPLTTPHTG